MSPVSQDAPTHYEVLEVSFDASEEEIRRAYRQACHRHHPDRNLGDTDAATSQFQLISEAYFTLSDCTYWGGISPSGCYEAYQILILINSPSGCPSI
jgi:preprotein translocase subunit Sec63